MGLPSRKRRRPMVGGVADHRLAHPQRLLERVVVVQIMLLRRLVVSSWRCWSLLYCLLLYFWFYREGMIEIMHENFIR